MPTCVPASKCAASGPGADAADADDRGTLAGEVRAAVAELLTALGEPLLRRVSVGFERAIWAPPGISRSGLPQLHAALYLHAGPRRRPSAALGHAGPNSIPRPAKHGISSRMRLVQHAPSTQHVQMHVHLQYFFATYACNVHRAC
jgi:hypothetical protein